MSYSRREMTGLITAMAALRVPAKAAAEELLASHCYSFSSLAGKTDGNGTEIRQVFSGTTHQGFPINLHITTLQAGQSPHPAHTHIHEEMMMIETGVLEVTISGQATRIGPGGVAYVASNDLHMLRNIGETAATYFVLAIGEERKSG